MSLIDSINKINNVSNDINKVSTEITTGVQKVTAVTGAFENAIDNLDVSINNLVQQVTGIDKVITQTVGSVVGSIGQVQQIAGSVVNAITNIPQTVSGILGTASNVAGKLVGAGMTSSTISSTISCGTGNMASAEIPDLDFLRFSSQVTPASAVMQQSSEGGDLYVYPPDLSGSVNTYMRLRFYKYDRTNRFTVATKEPKRTFVLPVPENLSQMSSLNYSELQFAGISALKESNFVFNKTGNDFGDIFTSGANLVKAMASTPAAQEALMKIMGNLALKSTAHLAGLGLIGDELFNTYTAARGSIINPQTTLYFEGVNLRTHDFQWKFVPRNEKESVAVREILKMIKFSALPPTQGAMMYYPDVVEVNILHGGQNESDWILKYKPAFVASMTINYTAEGTSAFFHNGAPVAVNLMLSIKEIEQEVRNDIFDDKAALDGINYWNETWGGFTECWKEGGDTIDNIVACGEKIIEGTGTFFGFNESESETEKATKK